ncbi:hypothetical protein Trydic_g19110 [Trypoxylus dichotomus]
MKGTLEELLKAGTRGAANPGNNLTEEREIDHEDEDINSEEEKEDKIGTWSCEITEANRRNLQTSTHYGSKMLRIMVMMTY